MEESELLAQFIEKNHCKTDHNEVTISPLFPMAVFYEQDAGKNV